MNGEEFIKFWKWSGIYFGYSGYQCCHSATVGTRIERGSAPQRLYWYNDQYQSTLL